MAMKSGANNGTGNGVKSATDCGVNKEHFELKLNAFFEEQFKGEGECKDSARRIKRDVSHHKKVVGVLRGQVDLVDLQSVPDGDFKWIMNYEDHAARFCHLRAPTFQRASKVALELLKILLTQGIPY
ncbi:hypothetical protein BC332_34766 [Capsicum chinense]|nr:hypothetical protein BC332_34766 [Capsicum chinense]